MQLKMVQAITEVDGDLGHDQSLKALYPNGRESHQSVLIVASQPALLWHWDTDVLLKYLLSQSGTEP